LIIIDLDNFKAVNDTRGHAAGDQLLVHVARCLETVVGDRGFAVRLGGDEFLLFFERLDGAEELDALCAELIAQFARDRRVNMLDVDVKFSVGASIYPDHGRTLSELLSNADIALYESKTSGKNTHRLFTPALRAARDARAQLEEDLGQALADGAFELFLQPRVSVADDSIVGAEALLRWRREDGRYTPPEAFIQASEDTGLIVPLGAWVIESAAREQRRLAALGHDLTISVNVSPRQFVTAGFAETLAAMIATADCAPDRIELEITETMLVRDDDANVALLERIRDMGFKLAIDDFGTGYSNLVTLQSFPVTSLKVDRSLIQTIGRPRSVAGLVLSFCDLLGIKAVAEGVETL
ncbi:MAG: bifunctional diguanylate cyclase/phosphodiesterase, partial [Pseudomonadota bacterium]